MFLKVDNVGAKRMCSGRLFQATGPATQNARLPNCSLVLITTKSPRAAERKVARLGTVRQRCVESHGEEHCTNISILDQLGLKWQS